MANYIQIYLRHAEIQEWVAMAQFMRGELVPLVGTVAEDVSESIEDAVRDGELTGTVTASDGTVYTYELRANEF